MFGGHIFARGTSVPYGNPDDWVGWVDFTDSNNYTSAGGEITSSNTIKNLIDGVDTNVFEGTLQVPYPGLGGIDGARPKTGTSALPLWYQQNISEVDLSDHINVVAIGLISSLAALDVNHRIAVYGRLPDPMAQSNWDGLYIMLQPTGSQLRVRGRMINPIYGANRDYTGGFPKNLHALCKYSPVSSGSVTIDTLDGGTAVDTTATGSKLTTWNQIGFRIYDGSTQIVINEMHWLRNASAQPVNETDLKNYINNKYGTSL